MKARIIGFLLSLALLTTVCAVNAQNGGQNFENPSVKMEFVSVVSGVTTLKITNKQACTADIQTKIGGVVRVKSYLPSSADTIKFSGLTGTNVKIQSRTLTNCGGADFGQTELTLNIDLLPVKFISFDVKYLEDTDEALVIFEVAEVINVKQFNVRMTLDGISYQVVTIIFPDTIQPNRVYTTKVKL